MTISRQKYDAVNVYAHRMLGYLHHHRTRIGVAAIGVLVVSLMPSAAHGATTNAVETVVHRFGNNFSSGPHDGKYPQSGLTQGPNGELFGATAGGGIGAGAPRGGCGTIFELSPNGVEHPIHSFNCFTDGGAPSSAPIADSSGALYGTAQIGGADGQGVVYKLTPSHGGYSYSILYSFSGGADGSNPAGPVVLDDKGDLYGTTSSGGTGCADGCGTVYELTPSGAGYEESVLYRFQGGDDGADPSYGLLLAPHGVIYGTTQGGFYGTSTIFRLAPTDTGGYAEAVLYRFCTACAGLQYASSGLVDGADGDLYGTAGNGFGGYTYQTNHGAVYKLDPGTGAVSVVYAFQGGRDGSDPQGLLAQDASGNLYGTTVSGGAAFCPSAPQGCGTVFELQRQSDGSFSESVLYTFPSPPGSSTVHTADGNTPLAGVMIANGVLYGTTYQGGNVNCDTDGGGCGTIFEVSAPGLAATQAARQPLVVVPDSTVQQDGDVGARMHTNQLLLATPSLASQGFNGRSPAGETPASIYPVYGLSSSATAGSGVIAIVDAFNDPTANHDLNVFSQQFGLPACTAANGCFTTVYASSQKPSRDCGWAQEESLDIEWAHAMAPGAKIVLVEAASNGIADLLSAVDVATSYIRDHGGKGEVSMSWGGSGLSGESQYDFYFTPPTGTNIVYIASSGDTGGVSSWPSESAKVVSAGGTTINRDSNGNFLSETGWSGSGGGPGFGNAKPSYQAGIPNTDDSWRTTPDLSFDADPHSGVSVYDSTACPAHGADYSGWLVFGGTSVAAPSLAGIINQAGNFAPDSTAELTTIYSQYDSASGDFGRNFRDITSGAAGGYTAGPGYDLVTGVGTPHGLSGK